MFNVTILDNKVKGGPGSGRRGHRTNRFKNINRNKKNMTQDSALFNKLKWQGNIKGEKVHHVLLAKNREKNWQTGKMDTFYSANSLRSTESHIRDWDGNVLKERKVDTASFGGVTFKESEIKPLIAELKQKKIPYTIL